MATGDESVVLTSLIDYRNVEPGIKPVWEALVTWTYDTDDAGLESLTIPELNGILLKIVISVPVTSRTGTTSQIIIKDSNDNTIFDSGEIAESATPYTFNLFEPLAGDIDISYEPSASATSAETPTALLRGI